jgi:hypothetical protein
VALEDKFVAGSGKFLASEYTYGGSIGAIRPRPVPRSHREKSGKHFFFQKKKQKFFQKKKQKTL